MYFEKFIAMVSSLELTLGLALTPEQALANTAKPRRACRRVGCVARQPPRTNRRHLFEHWPGEYHDGEHRNKGQLKGRIQKIARTPSQQCERGRSKRVKRRGATRNQRCQ